MSNLALATNCISPQENKIQFIYLHGIDTPEPGDLEIANRQVLKKISAKLSAKIALPRAPSPCTDNDFLCWNPQIDSPENALAQLNQAITLAANCLDLSLPIHLLAFSNGGYLAHKIIRYNLPLAFASITTVGAGGASLPSDPKPSSQELQMLLAENELTLPEARAFQNALNEKGAKIDLLTYKGEHELALEPILLSLRRIAK